MKVKTLSESKKPAGLHDAEDKALVAAIQSGLPLCARPYAEIGARIGMSEDEVMQRLQRMMQEQVIKRMGVVVKHHELGYRANAMVVWDIPDEHISRLGACMGQFDFVTLCYQRPRRLPDWQYNLFCMIHGQDMDEVYANIEILIERCELGSIDYDVLFSKRRFKQRGARYHRLHSNADAG